MKASICIATYDHPTLLKSTLDSIFRQSPPFEFEVIIVDDGSPTQETKNVCSEFPVKYIRIDRPPGIRNCCTARNVSYRAATGDVIICQSDDVLHSRENNIELLVKDLTPGYFLLANVFQKDESRGEYVGPTRRPLPFLFLGSVYRQDLYAVGGNDEDFSVGPAWDDRWFADCLLHGQHLIPKFSTTIVGCHQHHAIRSNLSIEIPSLAAYNAKYAAACKEEIPWQSSGGPWEYKHPQPRPPIKGVNSIVVCVEYDDFLAITLPKNKKYFDRTIVVTTWDDLRTHKVSYQNGCECFNTTEFGEHENYKVFNKGAALEAAFDQVLGRAGWIYIWDADVIIPETFSVDGLDKSCLYVPKRRILENPADYPAYTDYGSWDSLISPTRDFEFSGYSQLFYAKSIQPPWYSVISKHAGVSDSQFSEKFPKENRRRPGFEVLHLGPEGIPSMNTRAGYNWCGRVTPRIDTGEVSRKARHRKQEVMDLLKRGEI